MNHKLLVSMALGTLAGASMAQSSVTVFGVYDVAARSVRNEGRGTVQSLSADGLASSRLGFRGVEDLGNGLQAGFWIEHGFAGDTGTPADIGRFFNRRSTVSLLGRLGELRLGRDYTPSFYNVSVFSPFGLIGVAGLSHVLSVGNPLGSGALTFTRADNSISYLLPKALGGVYGHAMVAAGEGNDNNKYQGVRIGYESGPINVAAAYGRTALSAPGEYTVVNAGASYRFNGLTAMALLQAEKSGARKRHTWLLGGNFAVGQTELRAAYVKGDMKGDAPAGAGFRHADDISQWALGAIYSLSKRTALYATASLLRNEGAAAQRIPGGTASIAAGGDSTGWEMGVRMTF
jgi:predicted porin